MVTSLVVPALTLPGQRTKKGTRCPPSKIVALEPRQSPEGLYPAASILGIFTYGANPLSEV